MTNKEIDEIAAEILNKYKILRSLDIKKKNYFLSKLNALLLNDFTNDEKSIDKIIAKYLGNEIADEYKSATASAINDFISFLSEKKCHPYKVNEEIIKLYIKNEYENGKTQSFVRVKYSRLNQFYKYLADQKYILAENNPFTSIVLSEVEYHKEFNIPDDKEIQIILNALPLEIKTYLAIVIVKQYSESDFYDLNFNSTSLVAKETGGKKINVTYCWTNDDLWDFNIENKDNCIDSNDIFSMKNYSEFISTPKWYNEILNEFYDNYVEGKYFETEGGTRIEYSQFYYSNNHINLKAYDKRILKEIKKLYEKKQISFCFKLKDLRLYRIKTLYEETHSLAKIQKLLGHSTPNVTRRFLQNSGITI